MGQKRREKKEDFVLEADKCVGAWLTRDRKKMRCRALRAFGPLFLQRPAFHSGITGLGVLHRIRESDAFRIKLLQGPRIYI